MKFGAHMSTGGGVWKALQRGRGIGCDSVQIFVKSNMRWFGKPYSQSDLQLYAAERAVGTPEFVFGHSGYLINLAAPPSENRNLSIRSLISEIELAGALGLPFLVLHPGAHLGAGEAEGLKQAVVGLDEVIEATPESRVRIALENTAGQGTCLGHRLEHLADIYQRVRRPARLGLCLDTAHFFAAGYDLRSPKLWQSATRTISTHIGLREILGFHLNDSKTGLGSRVDRHAHIGEGELGKDAFRHIVNDRRFRKHPACLETPKSDDLREDVRNLDVLRSLLE